MVCHPPVPSPNPYIPLSRCSADNRIDTFSITSVCSPLPCRCRAEAVVAISSRRALLPHHTGCLSTIAAISARLCLLYSVLSLTPVPRHDAYAFVPRACSGYHRTHCITYITMFSAACARFLPTSLPRLRYLHDIAFCTHFRLCRLLPTYHHTTQHFFLLYDICSHLGFGLVITTCRGTLRTSPGVPLLGRTVRLLPHATTTRQRGRHGMRHTPFPHLFCHLLLLSAASLLTSQHTFPPLPYDTLHTSTHHTTHFAPHSCIAVFLNLVRGIFMRRPYAHFVAILCLISLMRLQRAAFIPCRIHFRCLPCYDIW